MERLVKYEIGLYITRAQFADQHLLEQSMDQPGYGC